MGGIEMIAERFRSSFLIICVGVVILTFILLNALENSQAAWALGVEDASTQNEAVPVIDVQGAAVKAGATANVVVSISNNPGIIGATLEVSYDESLVLTSITNGEAFQALDLTKPGEMTSGCNIHWDATDLADEDVKDGVIATLSFIVPSGASAGDSYSVEVAAATAKGKPDVYDRNLEPVDLQPARCNVTVVADAEHTTHTYSSWKTTVEPTCTQKGSRERVCTVCGETDVEDVDALGHAWDSGVVTKAPTYDVSGACTYTCSRCGTTRTEPIPALARTSLEGATIAPVASMTYTGKALEPNLTVQLDGVTLVKDADYTVAYVGNVNAGKATATVMGKGGYADSVSTTFAIAPASIENAKIVVARQTHTGKALTPAPTVTLNGKVLANGADYTVLYSDNVNVGMGKIVVTGRGNYTSMARSSFEIAAASTPEGEGGFPSDDSSVDNPSDGSASDGESSSSGNTSNSGLNDSSNGGQPSGEGDSQGGGSEPSPSPSVESCAMHRLYNPYTGEHFYTADESERDGLVPLGWEYEGLGWTAPATSDTPVFRMYNPYAGEHHYCMTEGERDMLTGVGWEYEGIGWYSDDEKRTPLYREYNPYMFSCNHNYTTSKEEHDGLVALGWVDEGYAWYGV